MERIQQLDALYAQYLADIEEARRSLRPSDGLLGTGGGLKDHPCHERFDKQIETAVQGFIAEDMDCTEAAQLTESLFREEDLTSDIQCVRLMLTAVQRHALHLIPLLSRDDAKRILSNYTTRYPLFARLPFQKEIIKALKAKAK